MIDDFVEELADICEKTAHSLLDGIPATPADATPTPPWELDRRAFKAGLGSEVPTQWIHDVLRIYLNEAAQQLIAIAALLRAHAVTSSLQPLVRAITERVGVICWLIDEKATDRQRVIRSGFVFTVSTQHYRDTLSRLGSNASIQKTMKKEHNRIDEMLDDWFGIEKPRDFMTGEEVADRMKWVIGGEKFPSYTELAQLALSHGNISKRKAAGSYGGMSGFSHPNVVFGSEHITTDSDGKITFTYDASDLEKLVRFAVGIFGEGVTRWLSYYCPERTDVVQQLDASQDRLNAMTAILELQNKDT